MGISGGEILADVTEGEGPEQRIHHRMHQHIGIAVAIQAKTIGMVQGHTPEDEGPSGHQPMDVVSVADAQLHAGI